MGTHCASHSSDEEPLFSTVVSVPGIMRRIHKVKALHIENQSLINTVCFGQKAFIGKGARIESLSRGPAGRKRYVLTKYNLLKRTLDTSVAWNRLRAKLLNTTTVLQNAWVADSLTKKHL